MASLDVASLDVASLDVAGGDDAGSGLAGDGEACQHASGDKQRAQDDLGAPCMTMRQFCQDEGCKAAIHICLQTLTLPRTGLISGVGNKLERG